MRTLRKFQLLAISTILLLGVSSCFKAKEPTFTAVVGTAYINQAGNYFKPYIYVYEAYSRQFATIHVTNSTEEYPMKTIGIGKQTDLSSYLYPLLTSIPTGKFDITTIGADGEQSSTSITFNIKESQIMGNLNVKTLTYTASDGVKGEWEAVTNATAYVLAITPIYKDAMGLDIYAEPETAFLYWDANDKTALSGTIKEGYFVNGQTYSIAVAAISGSQFPDVLVQKGSPLIITWGK